MIFNWNVYILTIMRFWTSFEPSVITSIIWHYSGGGSGVEGGSALLMPSCGGSSSSLSGLQRYLPGWKVWECLSAAPRSDFQVVRLSGPWAGMKILTLLWYHPSTMLLQSKDGNLGSSCGLHWHCRVEGPSHSAEIRSQAPI